MKINHSGMTVTIDEDKLNKGERWKASNDVRGFLDLLAAGHIRYMDLEARNEPETAQAEYEPIGSCTEVVVDSSGLHTKPRASRV